MDEDFKVTSDQTENQFEQAKEKYLRGEVVEDGDKENLDKFQKNDFEFMKMKEGSKFLEDMKDSIQNGHLVPLDNSIRLQFLSNHFICKNSEFVQNWREQIKTQLKQLV